MVFTTAYDQHALHACEVNPIDSLLKPVEAAALDRALNQLERIAGGEVPRPKLAALLEQVQAALKAPAIERIPARVGERVHLLDLSTVVHLAHADELHSWFGGRML